MEVALDGGAVVGFGTGLGFFVGLVSLVNLEAIFFSVDWDRSRAGRTLVTCCHGVADSMSMLCSASKPFQE